MPAFGKELDYLLGSAGIVALCSGHWKIMPLHMLSAACRIVSARAMFRSQGIDPEQVHRESECAIDSIPRDATEPKGTYLGPEALAVVERAKLFGGSEARHVVFAMVDDESDAAGFLLKHHFRVETKRAA